MKFPFFATLALFTHFCPTQQLTTAGTDGKDIFFNPEYLRSLPVDQQDGLLLHEVLHAALLHVLRRGVRDSQVWNIAADLVVNGMIAQQGVFELPPSGLRDPKLEHLSVEEIYELLLKDSNSRLSLPMPDLLSVAPGDSSSSQNEYNSSSSEAGSQWDFESGAGSSSQVKEAASHSQGDSESVKNPQTPEDVLRGLTTSQWVLIRVVLPVIPTLW